MGQLDSNVQSPTTVAQMMEHREELHLVWLISRSSL
jgi:hypothetical protein